MKLEERFEDCVILNHVGIDVKQCVKICDEEIVKVLTWITSEKSKYSIMYGDQENRFADFDREYTPTEILEIYKNNL